MNAAIRLAESGWLADGLIRWGIRRLLRRRLRQLGTDVLAQREALQQFAEHLRGCPLAVETEAANAQHYEVPAAFFEQVLGKRLKYSCALWPAEEAGSLDVAEEAMLSLTCERAQLTDGMEILELGCGWGSLALWMAESFPNAKITAISNSHSQREFIERRASERRLSNLRVITADIRSFQIDKRFDRVVSVEMFEHLQNYELLFSRIATWLKPAGKLFTHVFCHREAAYFFETEGDDNWMGRHFFTGGMMPADQLLPCFQRDLILERQWRVCGTHYARTSEAWLQNLDAQRARIEQILSDPSASESAAVQTQRWRLFFLAVAELFNYRAGQEWWVSHYRFVKRDG